MLGLGLPLVGMHLAQLAITTTNTIMIGWLGATELAAGVLGTQAFFILLMLGSGFAHALLPLIAHAQSRAAPAQVRRYVRMGLWIGVGFTTLCMVVLWQLESLLLILGQDPSASELAGRYIRIMQWSLYPAVLIMVLRSFLVSLERPQLLLWNTIAMALLNALLNYMLIFGHWGAPRMGIEGAAIASLVATWLGFLVVLAYATLDRFLGSFGVISKIWRPDWPALLEVVRLGWPISLTIVAEVGMFTASAILMGWLGTVPLAAHGIALQLASLTFMIPLGLSGAATVRIGQALGRDDYVNLRRAARTAVVMAAVAGSIGALLFLVLPEWLASLFLDRHNPSASAVLAYAVMLLIVAAGFQLLDSMQVTAVALLRGLKDTRVPMLIAILAYWGIGMPTAYMLGFVFELGGRGIWVGLACGITVAAVLLLRRFNHMAPLPTPV